MIKHIVSWKIKEGVDKQAVMHNIKVKLEALVGVIPQIAKLKVITDLEPTNTHDLVLLAVFKNMDDLKTYAQHPEHVKIAEEDIKPNVSDRFCADYRME